ncbi:MAG: hypothetical protein ACRDUY_09315 [Nitriliruptorales bacterium]
MAALPSVEELATQLTGNVGWLQGSYETAANLESLGLTDDDARDVYGERDIFTLAEEVLAVQRRDQELHVLANAEEARRVELEHERYKPEILSLPRTLLRGLAYGMPMGITVFASLVLLYSLWSYYYFTPAQATAIGLGTALSYFVAGGVTQAIGRRGLMYLRQGMYLMTLKVSMFFVGLGAAIAVGLGVLLFFAFNVVTVISRFESNLTIIYFVTLSILWVCLAVLYMLQQEVVFTVAVTFGVTVVYWMREYSGIESIIVAHQVGILSTAAFSLLAATGSLWWQHKRHHDPSQPATTELPRLVMLMSSVRTYLLYGTAYFLLLFVDRMLAWTGRMDFRQTFIWFRADYEAGLNWALLGMLPAFTVLELVLQRFGAAMKPQQLRYHLSARDRFSAFFLRFYLRQILLYFGVALVGVVFAYYGLLALVPSIPELAVIETPETRFAFYFGVIGYLAIGFSLLNLAVFFWLNRPRLAMVSLVPAIVANVAVGYLLSRMFSYHLAAVGLGVGGLVFAAVSTVLCLRVMSNLDYYYYSAF